MNLRNFEGDNDIFVLVSELKGAFLSLIKRVFGFHNPDTAAVCEERNEEKKPHTHFINYTCFIFQKFFNTMFFLQTSINICLLTLLKKKYMFSDEKSTEYVIRWKFTEMLCEYTTLLKQLQSFTKETTL